MTPEPNTSVDQAFEILDLLAREGSAGVADIARELSIAPSTAHRVLTTIYDSGFVDRDPSGSKYGLGPNAHLVVHGLFRQFGVQRAAIPFLSRIALGSGETTTLEVRLGWLAVRMAGFEGTNEIHSARRLGQATRLADTAGGLAILGRLDDEEVGRYLRWEGGGRRTAARTRAVREQIQEVSVAGYARKPGSGGEAEIAFPVCVQGRCIASICLDGNGPLVAGAGKRSSTKKVSSLVDSFVATLEADPSLAQDPFSHLDPDELTALAI